MAEIKAHNLSFFIFLTIVTAGFGLLLLYFFFPIFWAAVIAGLFKPLYDRLARSCKASMAAGILLIVIILIVFFPLALLGILLFGEATQIIAAINNDNYQLERLTQIFSQRLDGSAFFSRLGLSEAFITERISDAVKAIAGYLMLHLSNITQDTLALVVKFFIMLYCLFFFLKDGDRLINRLAAISPLGKEIDLFLRQRLLATANVIIRTTVIIGGIQGFLGGLLFFITGIEGALLWGVIMMLSSLLPAVGTAIVWVPAGVIMLLSGHLWEGVVILVFGAALIGLADNMLRPLLIGREAQIHPLLIFLSTLGGIVLFGFSGLLLGPLMAALFLASWSFFFRISPGVQSKEDELLPG